MMVVDLLGVLAELPDTLEVYLSDSEYGDTPLSRTEVRKFDHHGPNVLVLG